MKDPTQIKHVRLLKERQFVIAKLQENMVLLVDRIAPRKQKKLSLTMIEPDVFVKELQLVENFWHLTLLAQIAMLDSILQNHAIKNALF